VLWEWLLGALLAFVLALLTTPAGVSGAVLLLPLQVSVLGVPSPAVTPTNLLYNVLSTPGALMRFARERRLRTPLSALLVAGTLPGIIVGATVRVEFLSNSRDFMFIAAGVLLPLGLWLALGGQRVARSRPVPTLRLRAAVWALALTVGVVGGIYGIGGGSLLAPVLIAVGFSVYEVAPATLLATFVTSIVGVATYQVLQLSQGGAIAPQWVLGAFLGAGGFAGSYCGARLQSRLPERGLRRLLGCIACIVASRYVQLAATERPAPKVVPHSHPVGASQRLSRPPGGRKFSRPGENPARSSCGAMPLLKRARPPLCRLGPPKSVLSALPCAGRALDRGIRPGCGVGT
jgi:uncharacterized membrane protein YfcA